MHEVSIKRTKSAYKKHTQLSNTEGDSVHEASIKMTTSVPKGSTKFSKTECTSAHGMSIKMTKMLRKEAHDSAKQKVIPSAALFHVFTKGA